jgi:uncharacterized beta barrel domain-containing protein DUF5777
VTLSKTAACAAALLVLVAFPAAAQDPAAAPAAAQAAPSPDGALQLAQPDFTLIALPTALRLPSGKFAFRVTHRFARSLGEGDFGDLAGDFFGLDNGAVTALELRFGLLPGTQVGVHRSSLDKTVMFFAQNDLYSNGPFQINVWGSIDGTQNFQDSYRPAVGGILSRLIGDTAAFYVEPIWINNTNPQPSDEVEDNSTVIIGLGARIRIWGDAYVVGEWSPRVTGFDPGVDAAAFAFEKRVGGHMFQINFSNSFATTMGQMGRGGFDNEDWYLGFNITRKFF